jgi:hypothetical protein
MPTRFMSIVLAFLVCLTISCSKQTPSSKSEPVLLPALSPMVKVEQRWNEYTIKKSGERTSFEKEMEIIREKMNKTTPSIATIKELIIMANFVNSPSDMVIENISISAGTFSYKQDLPRIRVKATYRYGKNNTQVKDRPYLLTPSDKYEWLIMEEESSYLANEK